jgi:putative ABC transport system ATP-binding protein
MVGADGLPFVDIDGLHRHFLMGGQEVRALDGVSLSIGRGQFVAVMGPSGSGKSTLLNLLGGLDRPSSGHILVDGADLTAFDQDALCRFRQRRVGFVFQSFNLLPSMSARENVEYPLIFAGVDLRDRRARATRALERVGLQARLAHRPAELSGGEQQRVAIARSLINDPDLILADEPTGNLDSRTGAEVMDTLLSVNQAGKTIVMVTHDERVAIHAGRIIRMEDGRIMAQEERYATEN